MSSLTQALSVALSGLQTSTALIAVASNNISNAQTAGFTAKSATVTSVDYGANGGGSTISSYSRASNAALTSNYNAATSQASYASTLSSYMAQMQNILGATNSTNPALSSDIAQFSAAWSSYSSAPEDTTQQEQLLTAGQQLASDIQSVLSQTSTLSAQIQTDTATTVTTLNSELSQLAAVDSQLQNVSGTGANSESGDLEDQRDQLINQISSIVSVNVQSRANGQVALYTTTGQLLVDSGSALQFSYNGTDITDANGTVVTSAMTGGSLQAQLDFSSTTAASAASTTPGVGAIAKLQSQITALTNALTATGTGSFASAYAAAATSSTATGAIQNGTTVDSNFFTITNSPSTITLPITNSGQTVTVGGTIASPQNVSVTVGGTAYTYTVPYGATASTVAAGLAALIPNASSANGVITLGSGTATATSATGVPDASTFAVNTDLVDGDSEIPQVGTATVADSFNNTANYIAAGLKANSATYAGLTSQILSNFQQAASSLSAQSTSLTSQQTYYQTTLSSDTGVNIDTELANLVAYQNSYAASAHVISTVSQMLSDLMSIVTSTG